MKNLKCQKIDPRLCYCYTEDEDAIAMVIANRRNRMNYGGTNLPDGETASVEERLHQHYVACLAEIAVSRLLNLCWSGCGKGSTGIADVGYRYEVRSITDKKLGLLIRPKDCDREFILVFVDTSQRTCTMLGWQTKSAVIKTGRVYGENTSKPCWILPASDLLPMDELEIIS